MAQSTPSPLAHLTPVQQLRAGKLGLRLPMLITGLVGFGFSCALVLKSGLGALSWDVLTLGLMNITGASYGAITIITSFVVLLLWIPLKEMPGLGTLVNSILVGISADWALALIPTPEQPGVQWAYLIVGIFTFSFFDALYIGAQFGSGPRDGLMTGLMRITGQSAGIIRTALEVTVVLLGIAMGGQFGPGTIIVSLAIGPIIGFLLPRLTVPLVTPRG